MGAVALWAVETLESGLFAPKYDRKGMGSEDPAQRRIHRDALGGTCKVT